MNKVKQKINAKRKSKSLLRDKKWAHAKHILKLANARKYVSITEFIHTTALPGSFEMACRNYNGRALQYKVLNATRNLSKVKLS